MRLFAFKIEKKNPVVISFRLNRRVSMNMVGVLGISQDNFEHPERLDSVIQAFENNEENKDAAFFDFLDLYGFGYTTTVRMLKDLKDFLETMNNTIEKKIKHLEQKLIIAEILEERGRQIEKFGIQNYPILDPMLLHRDGIRMCVEYEIPSEKRAKQKLEIQLERNKLTYMHVLIEEVSEACECGSDVQSLKTELIQCAAVIIGMLESLERNGR
jgi:hypothetical protein